MIPSPPPEHNFDEVPVVEELDEFWHRKYGHDENGRLVRIAQTEDVVQPGDAERRAPAVALLLAAGAGLSGSRSSATASSSTPGGPCPAALLIIAGIYGWVMEPSTDPDSGHGHSEHDGHDDPSDAVETPDESNRPRSPTPRPRSPPTGSRSRWAPPHRPGRPPMPASASASGDTTEGAPVG